MFPNHYGSAFNSESKCLNYLESELFIKNLQIGLRMLQSIYIYFNFIGIFMSPFNGELYLISK